MWIKYRTKHSSGAHDWEFAQFASKKEAEEYLDVANQHNFSEHWRGIDWKVIKLPPPFILKEKLEAAKQYLEELHLRKIKAVQKQIKQLTEQLKVKQRIKPSCQKCGAHRWCKGVRMKDGTKIQGLWPIKKNSEECIKRFVLRSEK